jgi:hypothetical protein
MFKTHTINRCLKMINSKWTITSSETICNEKKARVAAYCISLQGFGTMRMHVITLRDLDLYPKMDHR